MKIDSHHHFWKYNPVQYEWINEDMSVLQRDFLPENLFEQLEATGLDGAVTVQASQTVEETHWLIELAEQHDRLRGVVGWVPLASDSLREHLESLTHHPILKAIRHVVQSEPDDRFILGDAFNRGISALKDFGLVYDILIYAKHLRPTIEFVDRHPEQIFVLDHIAKPTIGKNAFDQEWASNIGELAKRTNVFCKFSGVLTEVRDDSWNAELIRPYWDTALACFGPSRLMFGSDWPVCLLKSSYGRWVETVQAFTESLSATEQSDFWGRNAVRVYKLT